MSDAECARTSLGFLKKMLTTIALVGLLGIASLGSGVCQTPGYGERLDEWANITATIAGQTVSSSLREARATTQPSCPFAALDCLA